MARLYKVVPFIGLSKGNLSATEVAHQLESTISQYASQGWDFHQLADVNIEIQPGCISGLFGAKVQYVRFDQLIFRGDSASVAVPSSPSESPAHTQSPENPRVKGSFQPETAQGGKIKCWKCGKTNWPTQEKCWDCYANLYERE
jgi:hypothetical protein